MKMVQKRQNTLIKGHISSKNQGNTLIDVLSSLFLICSLFWIAVSAYTDSIYFDGFFANGAFQLFNPLRRLASGQVAGHDFQFFNGIGTLYIHYPLYLLAGRNLFASEFSRHMISPLLFLTSNLLFFITLTRKRYVSLFFSVAMCCVANLLYPTVYYPGNSLLGVRSTFPIIIASAILFILYNNKKQHAETPCKGACLTQIVIPLLLALSFFVSIEQGIYSLISYTIITAFFPVEKTNAINKIKTSLLTVILFGASTIFIYALVSGTHLTEPVYYALIDVPADQFWYFGSSPNYFITQLGDITNNSDIIINNMLTIILLTVYISAYLRKKTPETISILFLLVYALLTNINLLGMADTHYLHPLIRINVMVLIILFISIGNPKVFSRAYNTYMPNIVLTVTLILLLFFVVRLIETFEEISLPGYGKDKVSGVHLNKYWTDHVDNFQRIANTPGISRKNVETNHNVPNVSLWSTYSGLLEENLGIFNPSSDYIIHSLGHEGRQAYVEKFKEVKPDFVRTDKKDSWLYGEWLITSHWNFYELLLRNYNIVYLDNNGVIWKRSNKTWETNDAEWHANITNPAKAKTIRIPLDKNYWGGVIVVNVKYAIDNPYSFVPLVGKIPRYQIRQTGTQSSYVITLPDYETNFTFPIYLCNRSDFYISTLVNPNLGTEFEVQEIKYRYLTIGKEEENYLMALYPIFSNNCT
jgi:hypothetical protein